MAQGHPQGTSGTGSRRIALLIATAALAVAVAAGARADDPTAPLGNPDQIGSVNGQQRPDTDLTPNAKDAPMWKQRGGAVFETNAMVPDSPTSFDDDLTAVAFRTPDEGFAGGSRTLDCGGAKKNVPVIYAYRDTPDRGVAWENTLLGGCDGRPGYVGSIAFMPNGNALAVGGDGVYPKREPAYDAENAKGEPCNPPGVTGKPFGWNCDPAGKARVWLWDGQSWCEIGPECGDPLKADMRGLTAVAFWDSDVRGDFGFAGGLGQLWRWRGPRNQSESDKFDRRYDQKTVLPDMRAASRFVFRVRDIAFESKGGTPVAFAVTAGCCAPPAVPANDAGVAGPALGNTPRILGYQENGS